MPEADAIVLAIDQGTGSTKVLAVAAGHRVIARGSAPLAQHAPRPGWVEHEAVDILDSVREAVAECIAGLDANAICGIGMSNQRESLLLWERATGRPVSAVLSWQDRRTIDTCKRLQDAGHGPTVRRISGLPLDPMFSAVKAAWLIDSVDPSRARCEAGELCLGTVDSWLLWNFTGQHIIEIGNASRTSLLDLATGSWSPELLDVFDVPAAALPRIVDSVGIIGSATGLHPRLEGVPIGAVLGDSHAALFAHAGWRPGTVKATFGTGSSLMALEHDAAGEAPGLCRTIAWSLPGSRPAVALEANILSAGSTLTWLAGVLDSSPAELAEQAADDSGGVALVPAFNGLGAPWWDTDAEAIMSGMSLASGRGELARAALDSVVLQVSDVVSTFADAGVSTRELVVDGGISANDALMQRQADLCDVRVLVSSTAELSALGAAQAAGVALGLWTLDDLAARDRGYSAHEPVMDPGERARLLDIWHRAVARSHSH